MGRREILGLSARYVSAVILAPRKEDGSLDWKDAPAERGDYLYDLAVSRGLPHEQARHAAARMRLAQRSKRKEG